MTQRKLIKSKKPRTEYTQRRKKAKLKNKTKQLGRENT